MRKEFNIGYDQTISLIKQLKNSNDYLNKAIGVQSSNTIALRLKREQTVIQQTITKIQSLILKMEGSYLDPDTARKIGTAKQQFRIQKDRRKQLLQSIEVENKKGNDWDRPSKYSQITTFSADGIERNNQNTLSEQNEGSMRNGDFHKKKTRYNEEEQYDQMGIDFQQKIIRQRGQEINQVSKALLNVHNIVQQTSNLTFQQGEKIDIIGQQLFQTYRNVREARQNILQADQHQKRAKRKYVYFSLTVFLIVAIALGLILI